MTQNQQNDEIENENEINPKPLNDLSKLIRHDSIVNGDSDDLVHISWEHELNLDFPE